MGKTGIPEITLVGKRGEALKELASRFNPKLENKVEAPPVEKPKEEIPNQGADQKKADLIPEPKQPVNQAATAPSDAAPAVEKNDIDNKEIKPTEAVKEPVNSKQEVNPPTESTNSKEPEFSGIQDVSLGADLEIDVSEEDNKAIYERLKKPVPEVKPVVKDEDLVASFNSKYGAKFNSTEEIAELMAKQHKVIKAFEAKQKELDKLNNSKILEDPAIKEIIAIRENGGELRDVIETLNLLETDPNEKNADGSYKIPDERIIFEEYKKNLNSDLDDEDIRNEILLLTPFQKAKEAKSIREKMAATRKEGLVKWQKIRKNDKIKQEALQEASPEEAIIKAHNEMYERLKPQFSEIKELNGKKLGQKLTALVNSLIQDDPYWIRKVVSNPDGSENAKAMYEMVLKFHPDIPEQIKNQLFSKPSVDMENLEKQIEAKVLKRLSQVTVVPDSAGNSTATNKNGKDPFEVVRGWTEKSISSKDLKIVKV